MILAGRRINDNMGAYVVSQLVKAMLHKSIQVKGANVLIMGLTFKENCPDLRNTRIVDIIAELAEYNIAVDIYDPWVSPDEAQHEYGVAVLTEKPQQQYDAVIVAVAHEQFKAMSTEEYKALTKPVSIIYDLKYILEPQVSDLRL